MQRNRIWLALIVIFTNSLFWAGCGSNEKHLGIIEQKTFVKIIADLSTVQYLKISQEKKALMVRALFKKYGVTREKFNKTMDYYAENPQFWAAIYKQAQQILKDKNLTVPLTKSDSLKHR